MKKLGKNNKFLKNILPYIIGGLLVIGVWEVVSILTKRIFLPGFFSTLIKSFSLLGLIDTYGAILYTFLRLILAFIISSVIGIFFGTLSGYFPVMKRIMFPLVSVIRVFPTIALILLLVIYVPHASIYVVSFAVFPVMYQAALDGASRIYGDYEDEIRLNGKMNLRNISRIVFPLSADYLFLGTTQSIGLGLKVAIMSEVLTYKADYHGLGKNIYIAYQNVEYDSMMAYVLIALLLCLILDIIAVITKTLVESKLDIPKAK